jgi:hypothetical protein
MSVVAPRLDRPRALVLKAAPVGHWWILTEQRHALAYLHLNRLHAIIHIDVKLSNDASHAIIFTKPLDERRFRELRSELNIIDSRNVV